MRNDVQLDPETRLARAAALAQTADKRVGFWCQDDPGAAYDTELPDPRLLVGDDLDDGARARLAAYLKGGRVAEAYKGISYCRFRRRGCRPSINMGSCDLTDGVWTWPEGLYHYVEAHRVWLPEQFVEHALRGGK